MVISTPRRARKKLATRERIVSASIRVFSERGIEQATVDEIAEAADVGKGTIYNYFATKEDIVVAFMVDIERTIQPQVAALAESETTLTSALSRFVRLQFELKEPHHRFVRVFLAQMLGRTEKFAPWMQEIQTVIDPPMERLFVRLQERGLLRADVELPVLIGVFKTVQLGLTALWAIEGPPWHGTQHLLREEIRLFCEGLEVRRP